MASIKLKKPLTVLIVDDSRAIQAIVKRAVSQCGYEPVQIMLASDGEQAIEMVNGTEPDLIITDWHMPKVSGIEMLQTLRSNGHKNVKVGFVTTERTTSLLEQAKEAGAVFILHKPFNDAELVSTVKAAVEGLVSIDENQDRDIDRIQPDLPTQGTAKKIEPSNDPVPYMDIQLELTSKLGNIPFRLITGEKITPEKMTKNNFLALYQAKNTKGVYAIGVMDSNALCIVGGGLARKTPIEVRAAMSSGAPDKAMIVKAHEFMSSMSNSLGKTSHLESSDISMAKASIVQNTFEKLLEVVQQTGKRSDYRLSIPGYGDGRMAFFVLVS
jgi:CheY-like chemotaxis protein